MVSLVDLIESSPILCYPDSIRRVFVPTNPDIPILNDYRSVSGIEFGNMS